MMSPEQKAMLDVVRRQLTELRGEIAKAADAARPFLDAEDARRKFLLQRRTRTVNNLKTLLQGV